MEETEPRFLNSLTKFSRYQTLLKLTQLLVSFSIFSFLILSNSSHRSFSEFSSFPYHLFSHTIDKNCIFLFFNGLLFFVAKTSGSVSSCSSPVNNDPIIDQSVEKFDDYIDSPPPSSVLSDTENNEEREFQPVIMSKQEIKEEIDISDETKEEIDISDETKEEIDISDEDSVAKEEDDLQSSVDPQEEVTLFDDEFPVDVEEEEEEDNYDDEEENGMLSNDELNKKFDEFIRKMKEGIRIEAHRQSLVLVN